MRKRESPQTQVGSRVGDCAQHELNRLDQLVDKNLLDGVATVIVGALCKDKLLVLVDPLFGLGATALDQLGLLGGCLARGIRRVDTFCGSGFAFAGRRVGIKHAFNSCHGGAAHVGAWLYEEHEWHANENQNDHGF